MTAESPNPLEPLAQLFRDLRSTSGGLSSREAARRLEAAGPNELTRRGGRRWPGEPRFRATNGPLIRAERSCPLRAAPARVEVR